MIRKSVERFFLTTNAERVRAAIMPKQKCPAKPVPAQFAGAGLALPPRSHR
jgi:hypothetical protein